MHTNQEKITPIVKRELKINEYAEPFETAGDINSLQEWSSLPYKIPEKGTVVFHFSPANRTNTRIIWAFLELDEGLERHEMEELTNKTYLKFVLGEPGVSYVGRATRQENSLIFKEFIENKHINGIDFVRPGGEELPVPISEIKEVQASLMNLGEIVNE